MNPNDPRHRQRLFRSHENARLQLVPFRRNRVNRLRELVGHHFSDDGFSDRVPLNMMALAVGIYTRQVAAKSPQVLVATTPEELRISARDIEISTNDAIMDMALDRVFRRWALDAILSIGILKLGICPSESYALRDPTLDPGQCYADVVDLDDWAHDMSASRWEESAWMANRISLPLDAVRDDPYFERRSREALKATARKVHDEFGEDRPEALTQSPGGNYERDEYQEYVDVWEFYFPHDRLVMLVPVISEGYNSSGFGEPLSIVDDVGPEEGPFHRLSYQDVPKNTMPVAPAAQIADLHDLANRLFRKLGRQAERQKTVTGAALGADADARRVINAADGEMVRMDRPDAAREFRYGGIDGPNLAFLLQVKDLFSYYAGNIDAIGGLGPQADTLGQDQMLMASASQTIEDMRDITYDAAKGVVRQIAWWRVWTNPQLYLQVARSIPGTNVSVPITITPDSLRGNFLDYNFSIVPYSMQKRTPTQVLQTIRTVFNEIVLPGLPLMEQQGIGLNWEELLDVFARYSNTPELKQILMFTGPPRVYEPAARGGPPSRMPTSTTRRYERVNRPGATRHGSDQALMHALLGSALQGSETAGIGRPKGV